MLKNTRLYFLLTILVFVLSTQAFASTSKKVETHFAGTDYELKVYRLSGDDSAPTALVIGGIQGDEPGGYLAADFYTTRALQTGNLIIVPRLNLKGIYLNERLIDNKIDLNRQFQGTEHQVSEKLIQLLNSLIDQSDLFINLHDGWGFHREEEINWTYSPDRFGQSLITDADGYECNDGKLLDLKKHATYSLDYANSRLPADYHMTYFNTRTFEPDTRYPDMLKASTYYVLTRFCKPAFAIESSKSIKEIELRVMTHVHALEGLLESFGITFKSHSIKFDPPTLSYLIFRSGEKVLAVPNNGTLRVNKGTTLELQDVVSNYKEGNVCNIESLEGLNNKGKQFVASSDTVVYCKKDYIDSGKVDIVINPVNLKEDISFVNFPDSWYFAAELNGKYIEISEDEVLRLSSKDRFVILRVVNSSVGLLNSQDIKINVKGFVPPAKSRQNNGDDRGYQFSGDKNSFITRYASKDDPSKFAVEAKTPDGVARFYLKLY